MNENEKNNGNEESLYDDFYKKENYGIISSFEDGLIKKVDSLIDGRDKKFKEILGETMNNEWSQYLERFDDLKKELAYVGYAGQDYNIALKIHADEIFNGFLEDLSLKFFAQIKELF
jgi:preprotein translocase subunit SecA